MKTIKGILSGRIGVAWALLFILTAPSAQAAEVYLRAEAFDKDVPVDGGTTTVPMWGYALCTGTGGVIDGGSCGTPTSPGPVIEVTEGDNLTIYVDNQLPVLTNVITETSVLIPALPKPLAPARFPVTGDPSRDNRIYSFDAVTANAATGMYTWTAPSPGTYLYHSGTHPQVQVQMGLYGAVIVRANTSADCTTLPCAYSDVPYDDEVVLVLSEIDPALHAAVAGDTYNTVAGPTSTEVYVPRHFLINGEAFPSPALDPIFTAGYNRNLLARFVNAGIEDHSPQALGEYFEVIAQDGHRAPTSRQQVGLLLPAGKTKDVLLSPDALGTITLFDRGLRTVNDNGPNGGMYARIGVINNAPVADAGPDQTVVITSPIITLDGSGSSDANGDPLTYLWTFTSVPGGSGVDDSSLSAVSAVGPEFTADVPGDYVVQLTVNDGTSDSLPDSVTITVEANTPPVADAGPDQSVLITDLITLDGSASSDTNGDSLTYLWSFNSVPAGSSITDASLSDATIVNPTFTADIGGAYELQLIVDDGTDPSAPDSVIITVGPNTPPVADAGPDQNVAKGDLVTLDGSASSDANGHPITYSWSFTSVPAGSTASLSDPALVNPTFTADLAGDYIVQLIVNDGIDDSLVADTVTITATNTIPVANAGPDQNVTTGDPVTLDGSGSSDANGDALTYSWQLTVVPGGSTATLSDPAAVMPTFTADVAGLYTAQLIVNDGTDDSVADTVDITASDAPLNTPPVADAGPTQNVVKKTLVTLDGSASSDGDLDPLTYSWSLTTVPAGSTATLSDPTAVMPTFTPDLSGAYIAQLIVNDGMDPSAPALVTINASNTAPVANAGSDMNAIVGNPVQLDGSGSSDANGDTLTYAWNLSTVPAGSTASLSNASLVNPTFVPDLEGVYIVQLIVNDGTDDSPADSATITVAAGGGGTGPFEQTGGILSMEAEHFVTNVAQSGIPAWILLDPVGDASNTMAIKSALGAQTYTAGAGPFTTYEAQMDAGTQYVWLRFKAFDFQSDSVYVQLDGGAIQNRTLFPTNGQWGWVQLATPLVVGTSGVHTITVYRRERDAELDKLVATTNSAFNPATINGGLGPDESPRVGGGGNTPPMSNAGPDQSVKTGDLVQLDGSGSGDVDGDSITYSWSLTTVPAGSSASLSSTTAVNPTFTADLDGVYVAQLIVNDGMVNGLADTVTITAVPNAAPTANAGPDQNVARNALVQLDGSASSDPNGDPLTYSWSLTIVPAGSTAVLSSTTAVNPTFTADLDGSYTAELVVNDGTVDSLVADSVTVNVTNTAPVANAGPDQTVGIGDPVVLDGSGSSDANGDSLTYAWTLTTVPAGSTATLDDPSLAGPQFTADLAGDYIAELVVNDGTDSSLADTVTITAATASTGPFVQTGGVASMEAEHYMSNVAAGGVAAWALLDPVGDASNTMAIKAAPGAQTYTAGAGSSVTYDVQLAAGTQYVWLRFKAFDFQSDSVYVQLDGGAIQNRTLFPTNGQWGWVQLATPLAVGSAGVHTITVYRRERDAELDKVVISTNSALNPASLNGGLGPVESPRL